MQTLIEFFQSEYNWPPEIAEIQASLVISGDQEKWPPGRRAALRSDLMFWLAAKNR